MHPEGGKSLRVWNSWRRNADPSLETIWCYLFSRILLTSVTFGCRQNLWYSKANKQANRMLHRHTSPIASHWTNELSHQPLTTYLQSVWWTPRVAVNWTYFPNLCIYGHLTPIDGQQCPSHPSLFLAKSFWCGRSSLRHSIWYTQLALIFYTVASCS